MTQGTLGVPVRVPEGSYTLVLNDTKRSVSVVREQTTTTYAGRIEVSAPEQGTYSIEAAATFHGGCTTVLEATIPLGYGIHVLPGSYQVRINYSAGGQETLPVTVRNQP